MLEDYWLPRREGGRGTEVTTLPGGQTLGQMDDVLYFQKKFLQTLSVPVNRLNSDALFSLGRATEVSRDELKFARFIARLRNKFAVMFTRMLEKQLVLKQVMSIEDFQNIQQDIRYDFAKDNYFTELKEAEVLENRINLAQSILPLVGQYYSHEWMRKNVLQQTDDEIEEMDAEIDEEMNDPRWQPPMDPNDPNAQQQNVQPYTDDDGAAETPQTSDDREKIRQAEMTVRMMKEKKGNRSMQDESKYKSALQILAKNK